MSPQRPHNRASHMTQKRGVYQYRRRLPRPHEGEISVSLSTTSYREAEHLATLLDRAFENAVETMVDSPDLHAVLRTYLKDSLQADLEQHQDTRYGKGVYALSVDRDDDPVEEDLKIVGVLLDDAREALARRDYRSVSGAVDGLMASSGLPEDQRTQLGHGILRANVQKLEVARERVVGQYPPIETEERAATPPTFEAPSPTGPLLSEVLPDFLEFMTTEKGWRGQTLHQNRASYRMFMEWCGDKPTSAYTREDTGNFFGALRKLPALYAKDTRWRGLSLRETVEASAGADVDRLTMKTIKRHFSALGTLFGYLRERGLYEGENPAHSFKFPMKGRPTRGRALWEGEKLAALFATPVWTGCHPHFRARVGDNVIRDERFWLPILGLYHGNRLEEFAQLRCEDVREEDGISYLYIWDEGDRQIKNPQSMRRVPLHPELHRLGFLDHVTEAAPDPGDLVFSDLLPGGPDKKLGYYFTKWWSNYRRQVGVYERGFDYHSFRHGFVTKLTAAQVPDPIINELVGQEGATTAQKVYTHELPLAVLYEAVCRVEWPEVDLSHLHVDGE